MIGKVIFPQYEPVPIDYTEVATPLCFTDIASDLEAYAQMLPLGFEEPSRLILWQHQIDWLMKEWQAEERDKIRFGFEWLYDSSLPVGTIKVSAPSVKQVPRSDFPRSIFDIPVEVAN